MTDRRPAKALIYCRVSTTKQEDEGNGLESQEMLPPVCAEHGLRSRSRVSDSVSGGGDFMKRPGMALLNLDAQPGTNGYVVIFDDLKLLRAIPNSISVYGRLSDCKRARVECLNFRFEETPRANLAETILAAQGELEREQNRRQVIQKMQAHTRNGHWLFYPLSATASRKFPMAFQDWFAMSLSPRSCSMYLKAMRAGVPDPGRDRALSRRPARLAPRPERHGALGTSRPIAHAANLCWPHHRSKMEYPPRPRRARGVGIHRDVDGRAGPPARGCEGAGP